MTQTATLLVLLTGALLPAERSDLARFAAAKQLSLVAPTPTPPSTYAPYRSELVDDLEGRLDEARTLASSLDEERALALLDAVERELLRAPELPQAAFLMAERDRIEAEVRRGQPNGEASARELEERARALEGARTEPFGSASSAALPEATPVAFRVTDLGRGATLELDGEPKKEELQALPGRHQLRVLRGGEVVWAGWVELTGDATGARRELGLGVPPSVACTAEDLGSPDARGQRPLPPPDVRCEHWLAARRRNGRLEVAECRRNQCERFAAIPPRATEPPPLLPVWAQVTIAGVATVGSVVLVLWGAGTFDREPPPAPTTFVYGGLH